MKLVNGINLNAVSIKQLKEIAIEAKILYSSGVETVDSKKVIQAFVKRYNKLADEKAEKFPMVKSKHISFAYVIRSPFFM